MKQTTIKCGWLVSMDARIGDLKDAGRRPFELTR